MFVFESSMCSLYETAYLDLAGLISRVMISHQAPLIKSSKQIPERPLAQVKHVYFCHSIYAPPILAHLSTVIG